MGTRRMFLAISAVLALVFVAGCYTTKVYSPAPPGAQTYDDRQWFLLGGLVGLSDPAGSECKEGVAWQESEYTVSDALIQIGLALIGGTVAYFGCESIDNREEYYSCISGGNLIPWLFGSRTVHYKCKGS